jgi:hypothetical protein
LNFELGLNEEEVPCDVTIHRHSLLLRYVDNYSFDYYLNNRSYRISDLKRIHILYWAQIVPLFMKNSHRFDYMQGVSHLTVIWSSKGWRTIGPASSGFGRGRPSL